MKNLDLREILKDVPKGTKLYSTIYGEIYFDCIDCIDQLYPIRCHNIHGSGLEFTKEGKYHYNYNGECILFPSREKRDWSKFITKPFQNGDVISTGVGNFAIFSHYSSINAIVYHCVMTNNKIKIKQDTGIGYHHNCHLASHKEKEELYNKLQETGYFWNDENNSLEKYNFKVGDKIQNIITKDNHEIVNINHDYYILENNCCLKCSDQNKYIKEKFNINTLKPYDKVLIRRTDNRPWKPQLFSYLNIDKSSYLHRTVIVGGLSVKQCIPYEGNEHLVGTTDECDEYYKTWK